MSEDKTTENTDLSPFLRQSIGQFYEDHTEESLLSALTILADCMVWIPMSSETEEGEQTFPVPYILKCDEEYYFPVFSDAEEMGEYKEKPDNIRMPFMEALSMAKQLQQQQPELVGVVVNAFSESLPLPWDLLKVIEQYKNAASPEGA